MGVVHSTHVETKTKDENCPCASLSEPETTKLEQYGVVVKESSLSSNNDESDEQTTSSEDNEEDEEWVERLRILEDSRNLRKVAAFFLCPENPVVTDATVSARCYYSRYSAPEQTASITTIEDEIEANRVLADAQLLKQFAVDYLHPELPVATYPTAFGRNYFTRPSAPNNENDEILEERERIIEDMKQLKKLAVDYLNPEQPVITTDPCATGRNYFTRSSADTYGAEKERETVWKEMKQLKKLATDYLYPERPVVTSDTCACGRNYFTRPSAELYEDENDRADRDVVLEESKELKRFSQYYLQPERPIKVDLLASCRNYFTRPSASLQEEFYEAAKRDQALADAELLKKLAADYMHPERPVITTDPCVCCRNCFTRSSADTHDDGEERETIWGEMEQLKKLAVDYMYPERPVITTDPCVCGRNYFPRPSAYSEGSEEGDLILQEMEQLKKLAMDFNHPERTVITTDPFACGRNYYYRASAPGHSEHIYSEGATLEECVYADVHNPHHGYYHYQHKHHDDNLSHQSDHFDMDEDICHEFRESLTSAEFFKGEHPNEAEENQDGKESNLFGSPSSIMLFEQII